MVRNPVKLAIMILLLGAALMLGWWYLHPDQAPQTLRSYLPQRSDAGAVLYKWVDESGSLQVTDQPPQDRDYEEVYYPGDANLVPATQVDDP